MENHNQLNLGNPQIGLGTQVVSMAAITMIAENRNMEDSNEDNYNKCVDYTKCVCYLSEIEACDAVLFEDSELGQLYSLDTTHCVVGKGKKRYNSMNVYAIFGSYVDKSPLEVKDLIFKRGTGASSLVLNGQTCILWHEKHDIHTVDEIN